jgi:type I restriction enzyme S subunit
MISRTIAGGKYPTRPLAGLVEFLDHQRRPVKESERTPGPFPYYGANGQQGTIDNYLFDEQLVLLAEDGGFFDEPDRGIAYRIHGKTWVNNHAHVLRPTAEIDVAYLSRVLENYDVTPFITGTTRAKLTKAGAAKIPIPVPPLAEQRRIAAILDQSEALRAKRRLALLHLDTLLTSTFLDLFGDPVTNSKHVERKRIGEIGPVVTGTTPSRAKPEYYGTAIEWIKSDNLNTPHHYLTKAEEGLSVEGMGVARTAPAGAILVTCIAGSPDCIGNAGIADREVAFNQQINALIPRVGDYRFLYTQILVGKGLFRRASTAAIKGMISKSRFAEIPLLFPSLDRQQSFGQVFERIHVLKQTQLASLGKFDALFASLQHRAFRGEL